eukprot:6709354-Alexandrium_andersonii.AAC.1
MATARGATLGEDCRPRVGFRQERSGRGRSSIRTLPLRPQLRRTPSRPSPAPARGRLDHAAILP